jgi:hypothetical protein
LGSTNMEHKGEISISRNGYDQTLEVQNGIVSRLIEQGERLKGNEKCPHCGHFSPELRVLLDEIDKLSRLQNSVTRQSIQRMKESDRARA